MSIVSGEKAHLSHDVRTSPRTVERLLETYPMNVVGDRARRLLQVKNIRRKRT